MPEWNDDLRARLAGLRLTPTREAEIVDELSQHLDQRYEALRADGATDADARRLAIEELREPETLAQHMDGLRQAHVPPPITPGAPRGRLLADLWQDLRHAARMLRKQPGFAAAAILTLGLGIGANTAIFSLVNATLLQRLPFADRDRLVYVHRGNVGGVFPYPMYAALRDETRTLDGLAAWSGFAASLNAADTTDVTFGFLVTGNFFDVVGIKATRGRLIGPADDMTPGAHPVAVISHEFWQTRFAGRSDIIGHEIRLNGRPFTIVGVTPAGVSGPRLGRPRHVYVPMMMQALIRPPRAASGGEENADLLRNQFSSWLFGIGRLAPGMTPEQAQAELTTLATTYSRTTNPPPAAAPAAGPSAGPGAGSGNAAAGSGNAATASAAAPATTKPLPETRVPIVPLDRGDLGDRERLQGVAWLLGGVVAAVLLIACANIANLLLARAAARRRELAVRLAIGASRARLVRQLLTESVLLSSLGGLVGLALAWAVIGYFETAPPPPGALPVTVDVAIDWRVLLFSIGLSLITGLVFGAAPALKASRPGLVPALKDASADGGTRGRRVDLQKALVIAEVALAMLLLVPAGLFVRSLHAARAIDPGFDAERLAAAPLAINLLRYTTPQGREFYRQVVERVERLPGVQRASLARVGVLSGSSRVLGVMVEGRPDYSDEFIFSEGGGVVSGDRARINANIVGPGFFETLGIGLVRGRDFGEQDGDGRPPVVILNETAAAMHFGAASPLGARVSFGGRAGPWRDVVGVVRDSTYAALGEPALPVAYLPVAQNHVTGMTLYVRSSVPPSSMVASLRHEIRAIEPNLPVADVRPLTDTIGTSLYSARMGAWLLGAFGGLALLLAAIGIYGVLSFSIARRTREMGIRLALGAEQRGLFLLVVRDGMLLAGAGLVIGAAAGLAGARSLASFLYGVPATDVTTFVAAAVVLTGVALVACMIPARRAMRVDPIRALRYD